MVVFITTVIIRDAFYCSKPTPFYYQAVISVSRSCCCEEQYQRSHVGNWYI